jgi:hypothetical protein
MLTFHAVDIQKGMKVSIIIRIIFKYINKLNCGYTQVRVHKKTIDYSFSRQSPFEQINRTVFRNFYSPVTHPNLLKTHDGTSQNFASRKGQGMLNKTIDDEPVCVYYEL